MRREPSGTPRGSRRLPMSVEKVTRAGREVVWRVRWRQHGRNRARTFSTRRDARDFDAEVRRQRRAGSLPTLDAGTETLGEYVTETWAASHAATLAAKTRLHYASLYDYTSVRTSGRSLSARSRRRSSGVGRQIAWHRGRVPLRFGMRWICSARSWSTRSWRARLGESCPARKEGKIASAGGGAAAFARNDRGDAESARRARRDAHLCPCVCRSSSG